MVIARVLKKRLSVGGCLVFFERSSVVHETPVSSDPRDFHIANWLASFSIDGLYGLLPRFAPRHTSQQNTQ